MFASGDKTEHARLAKKASNAQLKAWRGDDSKKLIALADAQLDALLAVYHLLEERLPRNG